MTPTDRILLDARDACFRALRAVRDNTGHDYRHLVALYDAESALTAAIDIELRRKHGCPKEDIAA